MKWFIIPLLGLCVLGCTPEEAQVVTKMQYKVILAPESLYNCPVVRQWPKIETLSDLQTARLIVQLAENNKICRSSMDAIKAFYAKAAKQFAGK